MVKQKAICPKCGYEWDTKTEMYWVSCPRCMKKFKVNSKEEI